MQAPPNLSDDLAPLLDAGIDDWGGVSPVTADHVNPERAWPALEALRAATEAAGHTLAPRLTIYPAFALDPERWLDPALRFPVLDASDAEGLAREDRWCSGGETPPRCCYRADLGALVGRTARPAWGWSPTSEEPGVGAPGGVYSAAGGAVAEVLAGVALGQEVGEDGDRHPVLGPGARGAGGGRGGRPAAPGDQRRRGHLRGQPQHQLHQRLHLQVPVLRLLQGPALAEPAGRPLPARPGRGHPPGGGGRGGGRHRGLPAGRHPPEVRRRLLRRRPPGRAGRLRADPHPRLHRPGGDRGGPPVGGAAGRLPGATEGSRASRPCPARRPRSSTTRCGPSCARTRSTPRSGWRRTARPTRSGCAPTSPSCSARSSSR